MLLIKLYIIVSVMLLKRRCLSKVMIETNNLEDLAGMEDAVIQTLTTCYADQDKTILLLGDFSGDFVEKLSSHKSFSVVLCDVTKRAENSIPDVNHVHELRRHRVHLVVMMSAYWFRTSTLWVRYILSGYDGAKASVIVIGWSPDVKHGPCRQGWPIIDSLYNSYMNYMLNTNLMCQHPSKGLMLFTMNPFVNQAPAPWMLVNSFKLKNNGQYLYTYARKYREGKEMCSNLDFDRTHDLGRSEIETKNFHFSRKVVENGTVPEISSNRRVRIAYYKRLEFIDNFIAYVNARRKYLWERTIIGQIVIQDDRSWPQNPQLLKNQDFIIGADHTYPYDVECITFVTQFRGYKTQLQKILSVIDNNSWIGMYITYLVTLIFLKIFLRQPVIVGLLNLCRLTCNCGLIMRASLSAASQIYIACLLCLVVTMQGIFQGNLASLLTHDFPDRQADTIQDLAELGYRIYTPASFLSYFDNPAFKGRVHEVPQHADCIWVIFRDPLGACVMWGAGDIEWALENNLYISPNCIAIEYVCHRLPRRWFLEERLGKFLGMKIATSTMMPLGMQVDEKRMLEAESVEVVLEPKVMRFKDLRFAFVILGIGLSCSFITFTLEKIIYPFHHKKVKRTRVIHVAERTHPICNRTPASLPSLDRQQGVACRTEGNFEEEDADLHSVPSSGYERKKIATNTTTQSESRIDRGRRRRPQKIRSTCSDL